MQKQSNSALQSKQCLKMCYEKKTPLINACSLIKGDPLISVCKVAALIYN